MAKLQNRLRKHSEEDLERAKALYMEYESLGAISREIDIPRSTLQHYERTYWKEERDLLEIEAMTAIAGQKINKLRTISKSALKILERCMFELSNRKEPISTKEALDATRIMETLGKIANISEETKKEKEEDFIEVEKVSDMNPFNKKEPEEEVEVDEQKDT